ncbi:UNC-45 protein [Loa loa]|uniref:Protein unc-45 homolog B n=1 Tax=Loa loa TaxID=7209 RepID=A0A1I7V996_LOALO|nr:UNC-45 protein [Loa loa]EJD75017.1 UNC-45 protein [Loa loa]
MNTDNIQSAEELKDNGNNAFKNGQLNEAINCYTEALALNPDKKLKSIIYRNRAMIRLRMDDFEGCEMDATQALEFDGADAKALYRRALAREKMENYSGAIVDARNALKLEPKNSTVIDMLHRMMQLSEEKKKAAMSMENRVNAMNKLAFSDGNMEQRVTAMNNLLVLSRESETGASLVWNDGKIVETLLKIIDDNSTNEAIVIAAARVLDELVKSSSRVMHLVENLGIRRICRLMEKCAYPQYFDACSIIIQRLFNALAKMNQEKEIKPDPEICEANKVHIIRLILELEEMLTDVNIAAPLRDITIDLLLKNLMHMDGGLPRGWSWRFVEDRGLLKLLHISTQLPEQCDYPVTAETRQHLAICLTRLYDDMVFDTRRQIFKERVDVFFNNLLNDIVKPEVKVKLACMLITLLQGPVDVGINLVTNDQITALMLEMASSDDNLQQSTAAELIVHTVSKHERATTILKFGIPVLRKLYDSKDDMVKIRALVGLCKCASAGGDDTAKQTMQEGSTLKLAQTCKKFLLDVNRYSVEVRRFACEGLSYLTLDADVKEWIAEDSLLLQALLCLAKSAGSLCVYALASIYVNLTNSYDKPKIDEELVKLAQFAKHHVPETHPKDTDDYVERRVRLLVADGATTACIAISKTESRNALELLARAMLAFTEFSDLRGQILSEGGAKLCLHLAKNATPVGKIKAAHAIARLGSQVDPAIAFPGQRVYEVIRPLIELLHPDIEGRPNYDALLTLTNLASMNDSIRRRMIKERVVSKTEEYWFMTDHAQLRAAAAELLLNLLFCEDFFNEIVRSGTDRLKLWVLYSAEEDERLALASSGGFAILTENEAACKRIIDELKSWPEVLKDICMSENIEVQRRGLIGVANMMQSSEKVACEIVASEIFRVLIAITKLKDKDRVPAQEEARRALDAAVKWGIIRPTDREIYERNTGICTVPEE